MASPTAWFAPLTLLTLAAAASGCDSAGSTSTTPATRSIRIVTPAKGDCVDVPTDRKTSVQVTVVTGGVTLQPPGTCGATTACGYVQLAVGGKANNSGAADVIDLFSTPEAPLAGTIDLTATILDDSGTTMNDLDGNPLVASVTFTAKVSCNGNTGGTGGTTNSGGTGGTTNSGGTGGTTSSGGTGGTTNSGGTGGTTNSGGTGGTGGTTQSGGTGGI